MGAACCVATKDRTIQHRPSGEIVHRNSRQSPSWSFRWDNRVVAAGEESSIGGGSSVTNRRNLRDLKSTTHVSDVGSSLENYRLGRSLVDQERNKNLRSSATGHSIARNTSMKVNQSTDSPQLSDTSSLKLSPSMQSSPSLPTSPLSAQSHQLVQLASDTHNSFRNSPSTSSIVENVQIADEVPNASNDPTRVSYGNSFSHDNDSSRFNCGRKSGSVSMDFQVCEICSKLLTEKKTGWSTQKIISHNELSVVAVLVCGHVYHADCLESMTPKCNKYDPDCPICTVGKRLTSKMSGKSKNKFDFGRSSSSREGRSPKLSASPSLKPFLRRHFSLRLRDDKFASESQYVRKKGLFWTKSSRE